MVSDGALEKRLTEQIVGREYSTTTTKDGRMSRERLVSWPRFLLIQWKFRQNPNRVIGQLDE